jgi:hypothetical protein
MRTIRALTIAAAVVAVLPTIAAAQSGRQFKDAWFWGIKGGGVTLADSAGKYKQAATVGIDWLITRSHGGLYVSGEQTFFNQQRLILRDQTAQLDSGFRVVDIKNMRKLDMALMGFPGDHLRFHPYFGVGFTFSDVAEAAGRGPFGTPEQQTFTTSTIQNSRAAFAPLFIAGAQYRLARFSAFGQATMSPVNTGFILYNGKSMNFGYEIGLRYNVGTSISRE